MFDWEEKERSGKALQSSWREGRRAVGSRREEDDDDVGCLPGWEKEKQSWKKSELREATAAVGDDGDRGEGGGRGGKTGSAGKGRRGGGEASAGSPGRPTATHDDRGEAGKRRREEKSYFSHSVLFLFSPMSVSA